MSAVIVLFFLAAIACILLVVYVQKPCTKTKQPLIVSTLRPDGTPPENLRAARAFQRKYLLVYFLAVGV